MVIFILSQKSGHSYVDRDGCLRRCLPEITKINKDDIYRRVGINKLTDRADCQLLKLMYKRVGDDAYLDNTQGRRRLHDAPVLKIPFPNNETFKKSIILGAPHCGMPYQSILEISPRLNALKLK